MGEHGVLVVSSHPVPRPHCFRYTCVVFRSVTAPVVRAVSSAVVAVTNPKKPKTKANRSAGGDKDEAEDTADDPACFPGRAGRRGRRELRYRHVGVSRVAVTHKISPFLFHLAGKQENARPVGQVACRISLFVPLYRRE